MCKFTIWCVPGDPGVDQVKLPIHRKLALTIPQFLCPHFPRKYPTSPLATLAWLAVVVVAWHALHERGDVELNLREGVGQLPHRVLVCS